MLSITAGSGTGWVAIIVVHAQFYLQTLLQLPTLDTFRDALVLAMTLHLCCLMA